MPWRSLKEVLSYRELLVALTYRDIRVKYKQAVLGIAWVLFMPMLAIASGIIFRLAMAYFSGRPPEWRDMLAGMIKSVPWMMFATIVSSASNSLVGNQGLITKIYFPREVIPLSAVLSVLFDFTISLIGLIGLLTLLAVTSGPDFPVVMSWNLLWLVLLIGVLVLMAVGAGLFLSSANLFFRDVKYIVQVLLQFGIFYSLVFFTYTELGTWGWVLLFNPVAPVLESMRMVVIDGAIEPMMWPWLAYSSYVAVVGLLVASVLFERGEYLFAEYA